MRQVPSRYKEKSTGGVFVLSLLGISLLQQSPPALENENRSRQNFRKDRELEIAS